MNDREALLSHILAHPEDDTARLVFADWLDEHDEPDRAEFIRLQIALAQEDIALADGVPPRLTTHRAHPDSRVPVRRERILRMKELFANHRDAWLTGLPEWTHREIDFCRGFIFGLRASTQRWLADAAAFHAVAPITSLTLREADADILNTFTRPELARITDLTFSLRRFNAEAGSALARWSVDKPLRELRLMTSYTTREVAGLAAVAANEWPTLLSLNLEMLTDDAILTRLATNSSLVDLRELMVKCDNVSPETIQTLADSPYLGQLVSLALFSLGDGDKVLTLVRSERLPALRALFLPQSGLSADTVTRLAAEPGLARLRRLMLTSNLVGDAGAIALARSPFTAGLRELQLLSCEIGEAGALALAESPYLAGLESLSIWGNWVGERGQAALQERFGDRVR